MSIKVLILFILFLTGISVGSFINALEYRLYRGIDFLKQRSMCTKCKHILGALDLIPIVSFALIGGKCRYCGTKVSWQYPIVELLAGLLFIASGCYVMGRMHIYEIIDFLLLLLVSSFFGLILSLFHTT